MKIFTWIVLICFVGVCFWYTITNFGKAFPIVNLHITLDRETALAKSKQVNDMLFKLFNFAYIFQLVKELKWRPSENFLQAATFARDESIQYFIELECGGNEAFSKLLINDERFS